MASLSSDKNGNRTIQFVGIDKKRRSIRLGKMSKRQAEAIKRHIEHLAAAKISGAAAPDETTRWLSSLDQTLSDRLARVGLAEERKVLPLGQYLDQYIAERTDVEAATKAKYKSTRRKLLTFFGAETNLRAITPGDADRWHRSLRDQGMVENTARKHIAVAKVFFGAALRDELVATNPFSHLASAIMPNVDRFHFVTRDVAQKVIDACPNNEWRLIFALSRFGGLRCPSEHLALTWDCVNWEEGRLRVPSVKTKRHGKASRLIPLFSELRPYLEAAYDEAPEGSVYVIRKHRDTNINLRTQLCRIIDRAGVEPWPKLFQNLRSTRETELAEEYPLHVVTAWIGNSELVAAKHYLQTTDEHYSRALQKAVQSVHAPCRNEPQPQKGDLANPRQLRQNATQCKLVHKSIVAGEGLEPSRRLPGTGF